jgi:hypothetical protein
MKRSAILKAEVCVDMLHACLLGQWLHIATMQVPEDWGSAGCPPCHATQPPRLQQSKECREQGMRGRFGTEQ